MWEKIKELGLLNNYSYDAVEKAKPLLMHFFTILEELKHHGIVGVVYSLGITFEYHSKLPQSVIAYVSRGNNWPYEEPFFYIKTEYLYDGPMGEGYGPRGEGYYTSIQKTHPRKVEHLIKSSYRNPEEIVFNEEEIEDIELMAKS